MKQRVSRGDFFMPLMNVLLYLLLSMSKSEIGVRMDAILFASTVLPEVQTSAKQQ